MFRGTRRSVPDNLRVEEEILHAPQLRPSPQATMMAAPTTPMASITSLFGCCSSSLETQELARKVQKRGPGDYYHVHQKLHADLKHHVGAGKGGLTTTIKFKFV